MPKPADGVATPKEAAILWCRKGSEWPAIMRVPTGEVSRMERGL